MASTTSSVHSPLTNSFSMKCASRRSPAFSSDRMDAVFLASHRPTTRCKPYVGKGELEQRHVDLTRVALSVIVGMSDPPISPWRCSSSFQCSMKSPISRDVSRRSTAILSTLSSVTSSSCPSRRSRTASDFISIARFWVQIAVDRFVARDECQVVEIVTLETGEASVVVSSRVSELNHSYVLAFDATRHESVLATVMCSSRTVERS